MTKEVRTITIDELDHLGLDDEGNLYWKNQPVRIERKFKFSWWQGFLAFIAAVGAFLSGVMAFLDMFAKC